MEKKKIKIKITPKKETQLICVMCNHPYTEGNNEFCKICEEFLSGTHGKNDLSRKSQKKKAIQQSGDITSYESNLTNFDKSKTVSLQPPKIIIQKPKKIKYHPKKQKKLKKKNNSLNKFF